MKNVCTNYFAGGTDTVRHHGIGDDNEAGKKTIKATTKYIVWR